MTIKIESKKGKVEFGVMSFPDRKSKCLFYCRGAMLEPLAYFRNNECAEKFDQILDFIYEMWRTSDNTRMFP